MDAWESTEECFHLLLVDMQTMCKNDVAKLEFVALYHHVWIQNQGPSIATQSPD